MKLTVMKFDSVWSVAVARHSTPIIHENNFLPQMHPIHDTCQPFPLTCSVGMNFQEIKISAELWQMVLEELDKKDILNLSQVSSSLRTLALQFLFATIDPLNESRLLKWSVVGPAARAAIRFVLY